MCGRIYINTTLSGLLNAFGSVQAFDVGGLDNRLPRWNGAPSQYYPIIVRDRSREPEVQGPIFYSARWGLMPPWYKPKPGGAPPPINAKCETIASNGMFRSAYKSRRCLVPIHGFFEWKDIHGTGRNKQPYAIAMASGEPFCLAGIWESRKQADTGLEERTFAVVTCEPNEKMAAIHDRMPVILHPADYDRWLGIEPDPNDLMKPFPADLMTMWKIGSKVGSPKNDTPDILDPIEDSDDPEPTLI